MKARMKDNLIYNYQKFMRGELAAVYHTRGWSDYIELKEFLKSIEGGEVELTFISGDAFEKNDNNVWLPNELWVAI